MGKRAGIFVLCVLAVVPLLAAGFTVGSLFLTEQEGEAYEAFSQQNTQGGGILLADKGGNLFLVCLWEGGNTHLISIQPTACPIGQKDETFREIYADSGIGELKKWISRSLSAGISGYLEVDFSRMEGVVDALGGVELAGKSYNGQAFESYFHDLPNDSTRAKAQQNSVLAVGRRFCNAGFWKAQNALGKLLKITDTDLSLSALIKIGKKLSPALDGKGLYQHCLPDQGKWEIPDLPGMLAGPSGNIEDESNRYVV